MIHTTDHDWLRASSSAPSGRFRRTALGLLAVMLAAVANQHAMAVPIQISKQFDLEFGRMAPSTTQAGTVTINPNTGQRTATGGVVLLGGGLTRAKFPVTGDPDTAFSITLPSQITITSGGDSMTVNAFTSNPSGSGVLSGTGSANIWVAATLNLSANQPAGSYAGQYTVTVDYQ